AAYLSLTHDEATEFVLDLVAPLLADPERFTVLLDPKTKLVEEAQTRGIALPEYTNTSTGPDHDRRFTARVSLDGHASEGQGTSKKSAELMAARRLVELLLVEKPALPDVDSRAGDA